MFIFLFVMDSMDKIIKETKWLFLQKDLIF